MIPLLLKVIELDPNHAVALTHLGICYLRIKKYREAFNMLERAKECSLSEEN
jgi:tetratricopeptide (TPR) repeat protein